MLHSPAVKKNFRLLPAAFYQPPFAEGAVGKAVPFPEGDRGLRDFFRGEEGVAEAGKPEARPVRRRVEEDDPLPGAGGGDVKKALLLPEGRLTYSELSERLCSLARQPSLSDGCFI